MNADDPSPRHIAAEIAVFVLLFLFVGALFAGWRAWREGPRVLTNTPHMPRDAEPIR